MNIKGLLKSETLCQMPSADGTLPEEGSPWITRNYYYDKLGRVIQTTESDYPGWAACYSTKYDFAGRVVAKMESHRAPGDQSWHSLLTQYSYDDRGRLLSISREVDGMELADVNCSYDALGRLTGKTFGDAMDPGYGTQTFNYDIHGWATAINSLYNGSDLFREALNYASAQKPGTAARWDGNIAEAAFTDPDGSHTYAYTYDGMGRLTDAKHYAGDSNTVSIQCTEKNISYNRNGCITGLERYGAEGLSESVIFGHTGNRLSSISSWNGAGLLENGHFTYDAMGNMLTDSRKGLEFSYNLANLPESVEGADGASLTYSYLSDGSKWRASANSGQSILYRGSFVYEDDGNSSRISSIAWDEGRISYHYASAIDSLAVVDSLEVELGEIVVVDTMAVDIVEDGICDEWHVRDHLGSVRAIAGIGNYITGVRELNTYLPFGTRIPGSIQATDNRHRFGGKEEQRYGSFSLGLSDFGARYYDPFTCRWTTRDPMAGKYYSLSPYNYCAGNPVNMVDPEGSVIGNIIGALVGAGSDYIGQVAVNAAVNLSNGKSLKGILTKDIDLADIGIAAIEGFLTSGASAGKTFSKKGAKVLVSAIAGAVAGAVDYTVEKGPETGSAQSVITGAVAGTLAGSADPGIKTKNVMTNTSSNKATNKAREKALNKGHGLPTEEAKRIAAKNSAKNSEKAAINNAINNSVNDAVMSSTKWFNNYIWMMEKEQQNQ